MALCLGRCCLFFCPFVVGGLYFCHVYVSPTQVSQLDPSTGPPTAQWGLISRDSALGRPFLRMSPRCMTRGRHGRLPVLGSGARLSSVMVTLPESSASNSKWSPFPSPAGETVSTLEISFCNSLPGFHIVTFLGTFSIRPLRFPPGKPLLSKKPGISFLAFSF